ncbi:hypothetical protein IscW_ISCW014844 [Ixodes scapularis]|uniref:Uncharacterized protein n=1 Tax=Ixodes scapularis TaxID=6945 RepID=B7QGM7_IXOSC|nr:hypothetical protein IscW_ISCW014844 [Ixodes scapularis]|eukprot:XP_002399921.1 hypothetical protein IscW_ISCW014844 [Ixodes scapularis]
MMLTPDYAKLGCRSESGVLSLFGVVFAFVAFLPGVRAHGRLIEPPARNAMWRFNYDTPFNFEDSELFCGGIKAHLESEKMTICCGGSSAAAFRAFSMATSSAVVDDVATSSFPLHSAPV